ncbi:MAG TPA: DUF58 domain-containing protein [Gammaproteobacteria bacterium]|jgi:uncharacterized protein (DUF58 family)|nr:DUF58 domain-containing protein [Gammaproteobacteria bacterium]
MPAVRALERWAAHWVRRRQGEDSHTVAVGRRRVYILPTRFGAVFSVIVFAMLLGSINYAASLAFALTFLLAGLGLVVMHHCHNNLLGTQIRFLGAPPVFAGERAEFRLAVRNTSAAPRYEIELVQRGHRAGPVDVPPGTTEILRLGTDTQRRGWLALERFTVETRHPGRLLRAWTWVHMDARCLVYPRPAPPGRPLPETTGYGNAGKPDAGDEDFAGLRTAAPGDPPQRIAWKAYARNDQLLLKQFAAGDRAPCLLDWHTLAGLDAEARLAQLTRWCLDADGEGRAFGLALPGARVPLGSGPRHLAACLEALALFDADAAARGRGTQGAVAEPPR